MKIFSISGGKNQKAPQHIGAFRDAFFVPEIRNDAVLRALYVPLDSS
jgi:hypothetical protein